MSPSAKVSWEETTKWGFRVCFSMFTIFFGIGLNAFIQMRDDTNAILRNQAAFERVIEDMKADIALNRSYIDKLRDE